MRINPLRAGVVAALAAFLLAGCGDTKKLAGVDGPSQIEVERSKTDLKQLGMSFQLFADDHQGRGPKDVEVLSPYMKESPKLLEELRPDGKYVFHWGLSRSAMAAKQGISSTILAYLKEKLGNGGHVVVMGDAAPTVLTDAEFQEKLKAQGK